MPNVLADALKKTTQENFRKKIRELILSNAEYLANIKIGFAGPTRHGHDWSLGPAYDKTLDGLVLDDILADTSLSGLNAIHTELTMKPGAAAPAIEPTKNLEGIFSFVQPLMDMFSRFFKGEGGGFFGQIIGMFHKLQVAFDPTVALSKEEIDASKYSELFLEAGKKDKSIHALYRKLQQETYSDEQKINGLLKHVKTLTGNKQAKQAHQLLKAAEKKLLGGRIGSDAQMPDKIKDRVVENLEKAYRLANNLAVGAVIANANDDNRIKSAGRAVSKLVEKMAEQEKQLKDSSLKKEEKLVVYQTLHENKRKLLHFIVKTDALANGETLTLGKQLDAAYMAKQLDKFADNSGTAGVAHAVDAEAITRGKSIFKLFQNNANPVVVGPVYGVDAEDLKNQGSFEHAVAKSQDVRVKEIKSQISKSQKIVAELNAEWAVNQITIASLPPQIAILRGRQPGSEWSLEDKMHKLEQEQVDLEKAAVSIQNHINQNISDKAAYDHAAATANRAGIMPATNTACGASASVNRFVNTVMPKIINPGGGAPVPVGVNPALWASMAPAVVDALNPTIPGSPAVGTQLEQFAVIKTLQEHAADLLKSAEHLKERLLVEPVTSARAKAGAGL